MGRATSSVRSAGPDGKPGLIHSWRALMVGGIALIGVGCYYWFLRPPLLPEDVRYTGMSLPEVSAVVPGLRNWLTKVFMVLAVTTLSGAMSIGLMVAVNFVIRSDFRWILLLLIAPWTSAVFLYWREGTWTATQAG